MIRTKFAIHRDDGDIREFTANGMRKVLAHLAPGNYTLLVRERVVKHKAHDMTKLHEYIIYSVSGYRIGCIEAASLRDAARIQCGSGFLFCAHKSGAGWKYRAINGAEYWISRAY